MTAQLKVACLGAGYFSRFHYDAWNRIESVKLVGAADKDLEKVRAIGAPAFSDLAEMLTAAQPDILDIITPPSTHMPAIETAINAGIKTIICQKPFCQSLEQAEVAVQSAKDANVQLIVHENFRFQPWFRTMRNAIDVGLLGDVQQLTFRLRTGDGQGPNAYLDRQPYFQQMERFLIHETGVHYVDTFQYLLGPIQSVYADLRKLNPAIRGEDAAYVICEMDNGVRAIFDGNRHLDHAADNHRMTFGETLLEGTKGSLELRGDGSVHLRAFDETGKSCLLPVQSWQGFAGDCVYALQNHVVSGLLSGSLIENTAKDYLQVLRIEQAIYKSAKNGARLEI